VPRPDGWSASYRKLRRRGAFDFPVLSVGAAVRREAGRVVEARIVLGAVASAPVRASRAEAALAGRSLDPEAIAEAAEAAAGPARPMDNTDFSFLWRKEMTKKWVSAALSDLSRAPGLP
jgi:CO/xanthine dehydrogenase FAD-binding subunit